MTIIVKRIEFNEEEDNKQKSQLSQNKSWQPQSESQRPQNAELSQSTDNKNRLPQNVDNKGGRPQNATDVLWLVDGKIQQPQNAGQQDARRSQSVRPPQNIENGNRPQNESRRLQDAESNCQACKIGSGTAQNNAAKRLSSDGNRSEIRNELGEMQKADRKGEYKAEEKQKEDQGVENRGDGRNERNRKVESYKEDVGKRDVESRVDDVKKEEKKGDMRQSKEGEGVDKRDAESRGDDVKKEDRSGVARSENVDKDAKTENRKEGINKSDAENREDGRNERSGDKDRKVESRKEEIDEKGVEDRDNKGHDAGKEDGKDGVGRSKEGEKSRNDDKEHDMRNDDRKEGARDERSRKVENRKEEVGKKDVESRGDNVKKEEEKGDVTSQGKEGDRKEDRRGEDEGEDKSKVESGVRGNRKGKGDGKGRKNKKKDKYDEKDEEDYDEWWNEDDTVAYPGVYNTMQVVDVTKNVVASTSQLRLAFNQLIERFADVNTKSYDYNVPEKYVVKELMLRKYKGKSLSSVKGTPVKEVVVLMLDNSGSMVWWTEILTKMAEVALKRKDVEVYLVPNGDIQERLTDKGREPVDGNEVMKKLYNRTIIYIGDFDGANTPILLSKNNNVIWFCNEVRYRDPQEHGWVTIDKDFQGMFFRTFTLEDLIAAMKEAVRKGYIPKYKKEKDLREAPIRRIYPI